MSQGTVATVRSGSGSSVRLRVSSRTDKPPFPQWVRNYFTPEELDGYTLDDVSATGGAELTLEGPLNGFSDYENCWRFFSCRNIFESVKAVIDFVGLDINCVGQLIAVPIVGQTFILRVTECEKTAESDAIRVKRITPVPGDRLRGTTLDLPPRKEGKACIVHGSSLTMWRPSIGNAWHGLDLHVNACTDESFAWIILNLKHSKINELVVWGIDHVPSETFLRLVDVAEKFGGFRITFAATALSQVDAKILDRLGIENTVAFQDKIASGKIHTEIQEIIVPDVSLIDPKAVETAETYFVLPLLHPHLVAPFTSVVPHMDCPKVLIHGPAQSGKSTLAKWMIARILKSSKMSVFEVNSSALFSKYLGSSEKRVTKLFKKAEIAAPSIILIEGIHSLCPSRYLQDDEGETGVRDTYDRMVATFLNCLDGLDTRDRKVAVIATSLLGPDQLDPAAVRPGRLETHIHVAAISHT